MVMPCLSVLLRMVNGVKCSVKQRSSEEATDCVDLVGCLSCQLATGSKLAGWLLAALLHCILA